MLFFVVVGLKAHVKMSADYGLYDSGSSSGFSDSLRSPPPSVMHTFSPSPSDRSYERFLVFNPQPSAPPEPVPDEPEKPSLTFEELPPSKDQSSSSAKSPQKTLEASKPDSFEETLDKPQNMHVSDDDAPQPVKMPDDFWIGPVFSEETRRRKKPAGKTAKQRKKTASVVSEEEQEELKFEEEEVQRLQSQQSLFYQVLCAIWQIVLQMLGFSCFLSQLE